MRDESELKLQTSSIRCPSPDDWHKVAFKMVRTGGGLQDEMLVVGWTRHCFATCAFAELELPPLYIMQLIGQWYCQEELHWIRDAVGVQREHFAIKLKHILRSLEPAL